MMIDSLFGSQLPTTLITSLRAFCVLNFFLIVLPLSLFAKFCTLRVVSVKEAHLGSTCGK